MRKTPEIPEVFFEEKDKAKGGARKTAKKQNVKQSNGQKVQVTIYLSKDAAQELERARYELLSKHDLRVAKSAIVELAIRQAAADIGGMAKALAGEE